MANMDRSTYNPANTQGANDFSSPWRQKSDSAIQIGLRRNAANPELQRMREQQTHGLGVNHPLEIAARQTQPPRDPSGWGRQGGGAASLDTPMSRPYAGHDGMANMIRALSGGAMKAEGIASMRDRNQLERNLDNNQVNMGIKHNLVLGGGDPSSYEPKTFVSGSQLPQHPFQGPPVQGQGLLAGTPHPNIPIPEIAQAQGLQSKPIGPSAARSPMDFTQARPLVQRQPNLPSTRAGGAAASPTAQPVGVQANGPQDLFQKHATHPVAISIQREAQDLRQRGFNGMAEQKLQDGYKQLVETLALEQGLADGPEAGAMLQTNPAAYREAAQRHRLSQTALPRSGGVDSVHAAARLFDGGLLPDYNEHFGPGMADGGDPLAAMASLLAHGHPGTEDPNSELMSGVDALLRKQYGPDAMNTVAAGPQAGFFSGMPTGENLRLQNMAASHAKQRQMRMSGSPPSVPVPPVPNPPHAANSEIYRRLFDGFNFEY